KGVEEPFFHLVGEPVDPLLVADVFEFDAYVTGIALLNMGQDSAQGRCPQADEVAGEEVLVEILFGKAVEGEVDVGAAVLSGADGIGFSQQVAFIAVAEDQAVGAQFLSPVHTVGGGHGPGGSGAVGRCGAFGYGAIGRCSTARRIGSGKTISACGGGGAVAALGYGEIKTFKEFAKFGVHGIGVFHVILIESLDIAWMRISYKRKVFHGTMRGAPFLAYKYRSKIAKL